jgi:hypothetical protein
VPFSATCPINASSSEQDFEIREEEDDKDDSDDEYVNHSLENTLKKEYQEAQRKAAEISGESGSEAFKSTIASDRPKRRAAKQTINYSNTVQTVFESSSEVQSDSASGILGSEVCVIENGILSRQLMCHQQAGNTGSQSLRNVKTVDFTTTARWKSRTIQEARPYPWADPFTPNKDDLKRWVCEGSPPPLDVEIYRREQRKKRAVTFRLPTPAIATMRTHSNYGESPAPNGYSNNIVQEYLSPNELFLEDFQAFKSLSDTEKQEVIQREAEEYGMEKPQGYNVSFHYNPHVEYHHFGSSHPMKPWRLTLTKQLIMAYGLEYTMDLYEPRPATYDEICIFHDREYTQFLKQ